MSLVPAVTELILAEFLYLQYEDDQKPIYLYIHSTGTTKGEKKLGYETEAFAVYDVMRYVKAPISTLCVGNAWVKQRCKGKPFRFTIINNNDKTGRMAIISTQTWLQPFSLDDHVKWRVVKTNTISANFNTLGVEASKDTREGSRLVK